MLRWRVRNVFTHALSFDVCFYEWNVLSKYLIFPEWKQWNFSSASAFAFKQKTEQLAFVWIISRKHTVLCYQQRRRWRWICHTQRSGRLPVSCLDVQSKINIWKCLPWLWACVCSLMIQVMFPRVHIMYELWEVLRVQCGYMPSATHEFPCANQ